MKRFLCASLAATAAVLMCVASPALAHEEISPSSIPIGRPAFLSLTAANEASVDLVRISVTAPEGAPFGSTTRQPPGWTVQKSDTEITWTGGKVAPDTFEQWGFEIERADQPGALEFNVTSGFANGNSDTHNVIVTAVAGDPTGPSAPATPDTTVSPSTPSAPTTVVPVARSSDDSFAIAALIVALLSGLLAGVALIVSLRGGRSGSPARKGEDW